MTVNTIDKRGTGPTRVYETAYRALVLDEEQVVLDASFEHASARRSAIVDLLLSNHDEVPSADVDDVRAPFGGADADAATAQVVALFVDAGADINCYLSEAQVDVGPLVMYSAFTDFGTGELSIEHYGTAEERLSALRDRAGIFTDDEEYFLAADEETCSTAIEMALSPTRGRLYLVEATRDPADGSYCTI
ncbi:hypothetical protein SAMN06295974_3847 [Plantibacter flavus]|uniref:Uncharacterized protein n=1 Tax=Plantibacter flavus TaxID=150123 RepID=A0A3N2BL46_9MICO|nr:hypothetical protein [Plantibacter flavus]ROR76007.1 hypothetical protein EDD42_3959 [Plantibacter flavus]SMG49362.1 hypothetical protein SAMN06295974_3847 [Plantibacter flavus]